MNDLEWDLEKKQKRLQQLIKSRTEANCDTRNMTASDIKREEEIDDLESEIADIEKQLADS